MELPPPLTATDKIYWNSALTDFLAVWPMTKDDTAFFTASVEGARSSSTKRIAAVVLSDTPLRSTFLIFLKGYVLGRIKQMSTNGVDGDT